MTVFTSLTLVAASGISPLAILAILVLVIFGVFTLLAKRKMSQWRTIPFEGRPDSDLFMSYKSNDATIVRFLAEQMMAQGHNVWFNEYRIVLRGWDTEFEEALKDGVATATRAVLFTNSLWAQSSWCVNTEAEHLIRRIGKQSCVEVRMLPDDGPHQRVPDLSGVQHITADGVDRWRLLQELLTALGYTYRTSKPAGCQSRPLRGKVNDVPYEINIGDWTVYGDGQVSMGNLVMPRLMRTDGGTRLSVNIIAGKRGHERKEINDLDDRRVFQNLRHLAHSYFQAFPLAGECVGVHLLLHGGLSHGAFSYWGKNAWCRKYAVVLPAGDGGADIEFIFTCSVYGPFSEFCRLAYQFDDLTASLRYGQWTTS